MLLTLLFRDRDCAKLLNLTDGGQVYDFYTTVTNKVLELAKALSEEEGSRVVHPLNNCRFISVSAAADVEGVMKSEYVAVLYKILDTITLKTPLKDIRAYIDKIAYPIARVEVKGGVRYYAYLNKMQISKKAVNKYFDTKDYKLICNPDKLKLVRIYTVAEVMAYIGGLRNMRAILKKLIMCVPYLITKTTGVKNIRVELLNRIKTETSEELDTLGDSIKDQNIVSPVSYYLYRLTLLALKEVAPNVLNGMNEVSIAIRKKKKEVMM